MTSKYHSWPAVKAAARRLQCSIEMVLWYAEQGKITTRTRRGATVYRPADLERLAGDPRISNALRGGFGAIPRTRAPLAGDLIAARIK